MDWATIMDIARAESYTIEHLADKTWGTIYRIEGKQFVFHEENNPMDTDVRWFLLEMDEELQTVASKGKKFNTRIAKKDIEKNRLLDIQRYFLEADQEFKARFLFSRMGVVKNEPTVDVFSNAGIYHPNYYQALQRMFRRRTKKVTWNRKKGAFMEYRIEEESEESFCLVLEIRKENEDVSMIVEVFGLLPEHHSYSEPSLPKRSFCYIPPGESGRAFDTSYQWDEPIANPRGYSHGKIEMRFEKFVL